jgi:glycosyltransferase involved in cell wall biosynthesis
MTIAPGLQPAPADAAPKRRIRDSATPTVASTIGERAADAGSATIASSIDDEISTGAVAVGLTVVMPAYRQARTIQEDLARVVGVLDGASLDFEIVVVVDGYVDDTLARAKAVAETEPRVRVLGYETNRGKGHAIRHGFACARGGLVAFLDAGMDIDPQALVRAVAAQRSARADVVVGSKRHRMSVVAYPWIRRVYSAGYQLLTRVLFGFDIQDTQVGMKLFRREVVDVVAPRLLVKRFAFDVELLAVAYLLGFTRYIEVPVTIVHDGFASSVRVRSVAEMLWDTAAVWYRAFIVRQYTRRALTLGDVNSGQRDANSAMPVGHGWRGVEH